MFNQYLMDNLNFTALDFETMTPERSSACAIGLVKVVDGVILEKYYTLLKPIPDNRTTTNTHVNGITWEMVINAPSFAEAWPKMEPFFVGQRLVAHNAEFDIDVLQHQCDFYNIHFNIQGVVDTYQLTHKSLDEVCSVLHVALDSHHDALCDATACAEVVLTLSGKKLSHPTGQAKRHIKAKDLSSEAKQPLAAEEVENKDTTFFQKKVVFTGNLTAFPQREVIAELLRKYGADINTSISRKTDIVVMGSGAGPSKMKKIQELQTAGYDIRVIHETEFLQILNDENIK